MLGIPPEDRPRIREWTDQILNRVEGTGELTDETVQAYIAQYQLFLDLVRHKRNHPADDMITHLIEAEVGTDDGSTSRLTDDEVADFALVLGAAGTETVTKLVGNAIVLFHRHPDQLQLLLDDPTRMPAAVEEVLRYWAPSHLQGRFSTREVTLHDSTIRAGYPVFLVTGSANRDPRAYTEPDRFDITRTGLPAPLGPRPRPALLHRCRSGP